MTSEAKIELSDSAAAQIAKILKAEESGSFLRVSVSGGGCSGFQYGFSIDDSFQDDDLIVENAGIKVAIDSVSVAYLEGSVIDYVKDLIGASFQIRNPNATAQCGCGTSFSI